MKKEWLVKTLTTGIFILFVSAGIVSAFNVNFEKESKSMNNDNTLYVGGSGEGNYTHIQDAIDNASDGDTVFVYDDSSPYMENLSVNKTIALIGENTITTIIEGWNYVYSDDVTISGFTFIGFGPALTIDGFSNNTIENCIFYDVAAGLILDESNNNIIRNCRFNHSGHFKLLGISRSSNNEISYCDFTDNWAGWADPAISIAFSKNIKIHDCNITYNDPCGIAISFSNIQITNSNIIGNNDTGIGIGTLSFCNIRNNWWGSTQGPTIMVGTGIFFRFLHKESITIREVENGEAIYFYSPRALFGTHHISPWLSEPVTDAGSSNINL